MKSISNNNLLLLNAFYNQLLSNTNDNIVKYYCIKNKKEISNICDSLLEAFKSPKEVDEYTQRYYQLFELYGQRDELGKLVIFADNSYHIAKEHEPDYFRELAELKSLYQGVLDEHEFKLKEFDKIKDETIEFSFHLSKIKVEYLNNIKGELIDTILPILVEFDLLNE